MAYIDLGFPICVEAGTTPSLTFSFFNIAPPPMSNAWRFFSIFGALLLLKSGNLCRAECRDKQQGWNPELLEQILSDK